MLAGLCVGAGYGVCHCMSHCMPRHVMLSSAALMCPNWCRKLLLFLIISSCAPDDVKKVLSINFKVSSYAPGGVKRCYASGCFVYPEGHQNMLLCMGASTGVVNVLEGALVCPRWSQRVLMRMMASKDVILP